MHVRPERRGMHDCYPAASLDAGGCVDDSDCAEGQRCLGAWFGSFVCQHPNDTCYRDEDCGEGMLCTSAFDAQQQRFVRGCVEQLAGCSLG